VHLPDYPPRFDTRLVQPYWDALERGEMQLPACSVCGAWQWYPSALVRCHGEASLQWKTVPRTGTVFTFTIVHRAFLPNADPSLPPYVAALVELDGMSGVRIPTVVLNTAATGPHIGMRVRLAPRKRTAYTLPAFEPYHRGNESASGHEELM